MAELKPCPFCGWSAARKVINTICGKKTVIHCTRPSCQMSYPSSFMVWHYKEETEEDAELRIAEEWNRRAEDV